MVAILAANGDLTWSAWREFTGVMLLAALVIPLVARRVAPTMLGARQTVFFDIPITAWCLERLGATGPFLILGTVAIAVNCATNFGIQGAVLGGLALVACTGVVHAMVETPTHIATTSSLALVFVAMGLALYLALVGSQVFKSARRVHRARQDLRNLANDLERRVDERTAALASTNAAISRFVPIEFLHALGHDDVRTARLGDAAARETTVLFADIRNFTALSERLSPAETFAFLNRCLSRLGPHIRSQSGFVDKYIGDAIMALFPHGPADAVRAAIAMQAELRGAQEGQTELSIGIGIHVGQVMMGTIGESQRFEATVISDAVNLTARLESLTKQLGCAILVSGAVVAALDEETRALARAVGRFVPKGKAQPVDVFEVFASDPASLRDQKLGTKAQFAAMLALYTEDNLEGAFALATELRDESPEDGPASWWFMRLAREVEAGEGRMTHGIVRLDDK